MKRRGTQDCQKHRSGALTRGEGDFRAFGVRISGMIKRIASCLRKAQSKVTKHPPTLPPSYTLTEAEFYSQNKLKPIHFYRLAYMKGKLGLCHLLLCVSNPSLDSVLLHNFKYPFWMSQDHHHLCCTLFYFYKS